MTNDELDRLEALAGAATTGPWSVERCRNGDPDGICGPDGSWLLSPHDGLCVSEEDLALILAAREAVPRLVAEVRRLRGLLAASDASEIRGIADKWVGK